MAYVTIEKVQGWLQTTKYDVSVDHVDPTQEATAADTVIPILEQRYNTSTWADDATTPPMVIRIIAMLVASFVLRKAVSQDDGIASYCDWLESRANALVEGIVTGAIDLPGVDPDPDSPLGGSTEFYPDQTATDLWESDTGGNPFLTSDGAPRYFEYGKVF